MSEKSDKSEIIYLGIDLGTSRSSVSASNGQRHVIESFVGWPADMVAKKVLKREVLIGHEALENRTLLDLYRPLERGLMKEGSEKDTAAVKALLQELIRHAGAEQGGEGRRVRAVVGVPAEALRVNKQQLRSAMRGLVSSLMIVSEPFAVAYGMEELLHAMIIDIGAGTADFCVMMGRFPGEEDQRTLDTAGDAIDEQLAKLVAARYPRARFSIHMVRRWKEEHGFVGEPKNPVKVSAPIDGRPTELDITDEMRAACESILPPAIETMIDLLARVEPEFQEKVRHNIVLSGGTALISGLGEAFEEALAEFGGGNVQVVTDPIFVGSDGGLAIALDAPEEDWEKLPA
ncbi:MAG TPA: rod shape-determining protein [Thermoanaerobaculia bacterium]|nr:rod shape-determining protein [Thermoanaerobaculia bacterium]